MPLDLILALIVATAVLVAIPGPNVALIIANTLAHGFRFGAITVLGTTLGIALQLALVVVGLGALLHLAAGAFLWLKWVGVAYLFYLGVTAWRQGARDMPEVAASGRPVRLVFWQGLGMALINPKTLLFSAAFLPQFVPVSAGSQGLVLAALIHLVVIFGSDLCWAAMAQTARRPIRRLGRLRHRLTGLFYFASSVGLSLARADR
ncbi:MAG: LysE family translocator [Ruegeria sp.]|uniref:LysE family translocator n=1 Tax=Ruegeria sp. TaxID=1879320 RepID=UPI00349F03F5